MNESIYIKNCIKNKIPLIFLKYGGEEYYCVLKNYKYSNTKSLIFNKNNTCSQKLSIGLKESFKFLVNNCKNYYFGKYNDKNMINYWEKLVCKPINWIEYNSLSIYIKDPEIIDIYKTIKYSKQKKIFICNELLKKVKILLNINYMVYITHNNWFDNNFNYICNLLKNNIYCSKIL